MRTFGEKLKVWMINDGKSFKLRARLMVRDESILSCILGDTPCSGIWDVNGSIQDER